MTLTSIIRNLESQLKKAEKLARQYDSHASTLRGKLEGVASVVGKSLGLTMSDGKASARKAPKSRKTTQASRKGKMSAAGRARIAAAQKARWAAWKSRKAGKTAPQGKAKQADKKFAKAAPVKAKRTISAKHRAAIAAAQKARWAKVKGAT